MLDSKMTSQWEKLFHYSFFNYIFSSRKLQKNDNFSKNKKLNAFFKIVHFLFGVQMQDVWNPLRENNVKICFKWLPLPMGHKKEVME